MKCGRFPREVKPDSAGISRPRVEPAPEPPGLLSSCGTERSAPYLSAALNGPGLNWSALPATRGVAPQSSLTPTDGPGAGVAKSTSPPAAVHQFDQPLVTPRLLRGRDC